MTLALRKTNLTPKQRRFVEEFQMDCNGKQAAIRAGYSPRTAAAQASQNLTKLNVQQALKEAIAARSERLEVDDDWVLSQLIENANRAMQASPVLDKDGELTGEWVYQGSVANRALELIGKHLGMFVDRHQVQHKGVINFTIGKGYVNPPEVVEGAISLL